MPRMISSNSTRAAGFGRERFRGSKLNTLHELRQPVVT
jgi:hypothetical protein